MISSVYLMSDEPLDTNPWFGKKEEWMIRQHLLKPGILILTFIALLPVCLLSQPTIIDTIYTENSLQASISLRMEYNLYYAEILPVFNQYISPGDFYLSGWITGEPDTNLGIRYYLSFPIQSIPTDYTIESVVFMLYQFYCHGDGGDDIFPLFYGTHYNLMTDHVDYGNSIEVTDFDPINYGTIGALSTDASPGWKQLDVTDEYIQDTNINRQYIQFMVYFPVISDWDFIDDCIYFRSSHHISPDGKPQIVITYQPTNHADDDVSASTPMVSAFPNPCKDYVTLSTKDNSSITEIALYNLKGQKVTAINTISNKNSGWTLTGTLLRASIS
jgi:hypothetical protein